MDNSSNRAFNCKNEELPVICKFALFGLKRDLADFTAYSPKFNGAYATGFEAKIAEVAELVEPQTETAQLKTITERLYATMEGLINPINRLSGYANMANDTLKVPPADFGITPLRKGINAKDAENVMKNLNIVNANIVRYKDLLTPVGLNDELMARFTEAATAIAADKQRQYEIVSNRKNLVQNNLTLLNGLFEQLSEILAIGKILYKGANAVKLKEYTFNELKKQVRRTAKPTNGTTGPPAEPTNPETTGA
jgi:hypothetical protein